jgi:hypothetical protein
MADAWDILPESERIANTTTVFIIFCEDKITEPAYFGGFQNPGKLKVNIVPEQKQGSAHLNNAVAYCLEKGLTEVSGGVHKIKDGVTDHLWCVYDRDLEHENIALINPADDIGFTNSVSMALSTGLKVAWSNDAFELWILLHFEDVPAGRRLHRRYIYDRLTDIFRSLPNPSPELTKKTKNPAFDYKETMKSGHNFLILVKPYLEGRRPEAIRRAKQLESMYKPTDTFHDRNPCTMVHNLVESLLSFH